MTNSPELPSVPEKSAPTQAPSEPEHLLVATSRAVAVERVSRGTAVAALGFGVGLVTDFMNLSPGIGSLLAETVAASLIGLGAIGVSLAGKHLLRFGSVRSSLVPLSAAGLGGSILAAVATTLLGGSTAGPLISALYLASIATSGIFTATLIVLSVVGLLVGFFDRDEEGAEAAADALL